MIDELLKSQFWPVFVIPAKAGIQLFKHVMDSRRSLPSKVLIGGGNDRLGDFLRGRHDLLMNGMVLLLNFNRVSYKISYVNYHIGID